MNRRVNFRLKALEAYNYILTDYIIIYSYLQIPKDGLEAI